MTGSNKILTVSYGTFSCTLEGFDQPFNTMQSIAEYFRDLAAEDRYFGAEPPQPDAQMLHQIAEREVQKRVEARVLDNGVALRQVGSDKPKAPAPQPLVDSAPASVEAEDVDSSPFASGEGDSVADKLSRIRAVVAKARAEKATYAEDEPVEDAVLSDSLEEAFEGIEVEFSASDEDDEAPAQDDTDEVASLVDSTILTDLSVPASPNSEEAEGAERDAEEVRAAEEAEAAERAAEETRAAEEDEATERAAEETRAAEEAEAAERAAEETRAAEEAEAAERAAEETETDEPQQLVEAAEDDEAPEADEGAPTDQTMAEPVAPQGPVARVIKLKRRDFEAALAAGDIEEVEDDETASETDSDVIAEIDVDDDDLAAAEAFDRDTAEDEDQDELTAGIRDLVSDSGLDEDEEEDLVAELAEVERDARQLESEGRPAARTLDEVIESELAGDSSADAENVGVDEAVSPSDADEDADTSEVHGESEAALERLLDKTNAQMGDAEGHRRRSAIAHLKAAVAATKADDGLRDKRKEQDDEAISQFRDDLAQVVRPSRPAAGRDGAKGTQRPRDPLADRPAPLVLVSEQRVDQPNGDVTVKVTPARPTRVAGTNDAPAETEARSDESFSDFAQRVGAQELPDILEAAAAYAKIVEGQEGVTRPAMLRRAASAAEGEISREEGLQSFGQLLRTGRIHKLGQGQFAIDDNAEVIEKARAAMH